MRKLASIREVKEIIPIDGADRIETILVDGWRVISQKGLYSVGSRLVFFEPDSILPVASWNDLVDPENPQPVRIKAKKFKGVVSQGYHCPVDKAGVENEEIGADITEKLGVLKRELPESGSQEARGNFPGFLRKTDTERIQNLSEYLQEYHDILFYATEKLEGQSVTFYKKNGEFGVCSRNLDLKNTEGSRHWKIARELKIEENLPDNFAIQAECIGQGIQSNIYKLPNNTIRVFDVYDIEKQEYLDLERAKNFVEKMQLKFVPIIDFNPLWSYGETVEKILEYSNGRSQLADTKREGVVFKPQVEMRDKLGNRVSFKAISPVYVLKSGS